MKKITVLIIFAFIINNIVFSQSCLPYGILINTQEEIDNFQTNYPGCTEIEGGVVIYDQGTNNITNLNGLNVITSIGGFLVIGENNNLTNLAGLENLNYIGENLEIEYNNSLTDITALSNITTIGENLQISNNDLLNSLQGLNNITSVGGYVNIFLCNGLLSLSGLNNLTSIGGALRITLNPILINIDGLENITSIGELLMIGFNSVLTNLDGLNSLNSIGGVIYLWRNDSLVSIQGLQNVTSINGGIRITENASLMSLEGLNNISAVSIEWLEIYVNSSLSTCEVESVCEYLANPTGYVSIGNNSSGCDSEQEVIDACTVGIYGNIEDDFLIYPNPADRIITISHKTNLSIDRVNIFNCLGKKVLTQYNRTNTIDISTLQQGLFFVELYSGELIIRKKLVIN